MNISIRLQQRISVLYGPTVCVDRTRTWKEKSKKVFLGKVSPLMN